MRRIGVLALPLCAVGACGLFGEAGEGDGADETGGHEIPIEPGVWGAPWGEGCEDLDGDAHGPGCELGDDCDQGDATVFEGAPEIPLDGKDNDCADDGDLLPNDANGVFVCDPGACTVDAGAPLGTQANPYPTLVAANEAFITWPAPHMFVAGGTYDPGVAFGARASIHGGFSPTDWSYDPVNHPTIVHSTVSSSADGRRYAFTGLTIDPGDFDVARVWALGCSTFDLCVIANNEIVNINAGVGEAVGINGNGVHTIAVQNRIGVGSGWRATCGAAQTPAFFASNTCRFNASMNMVKTGFVTYPIGQGVYANNSIYSAMPETPDRFRPFTPNGPTAAVNNFTHAGVAYEEVWMEMTELEPVGVVAHHNAMAGEFDCWVNNGGLAGCVSKVEAVNACDFWWCADASGNLQLGANAGVDGEGRYLDAGALVGAGTDPSAFFGGHAYDVNGDPRPDAMWSIGAFNP